MTLTSFPMVLVDKERCAKALNNLLSQLYKLQQIET